jgi:hypothetical protein
MTAHGMAGGGIEVHDTNGRGLPPGEAREAGQVMYCVQGIPDTTGRSEMKGRGNARMLQLGAYASLVLWPLTSCLAADKDTEDIGAQLKTETYVSEVLARRQRLVSSLLAVIDDEKATMRQRIRAVTIVGEIRAKEAVPVLIRNVDAVRAGRASMNLEEMSPCLGALRKIGKPGTEPILRKLRNPLLAHQRLMFTRVLLAIEGGKVSEFMLKEYLAEAKTDGERVRLERSLEWLRKLKGGQPEAN